MLPFERNLIGAPLAGLGGDVLQAAAGGGGIAEVGGGSQRAEVTLAGQDSYDVAFPGNVTANNLLVVAGNTFDTDGDPLPVVTDTRGTSYTVLSMLWFSNLDRIFIAYGIAPSSGPNTVTINPTGDAVSSYCSAAIDEFSGVNTVTPLDVDGGGSSGNGTSASDSITTGVANALIIGAMNHLTAGSPTITENDGTLIGEHEDNSSVGAYSAIFQIVTTAQAYTIDWTVGATVDWGVYTASFRPA